MTVFNRRDVTLSCLRSLREQRQEGVELSVFVVDDASPDGTGAAIAAEFPEVELVHGTGELYWNGGMRLGLEVARAGDFDFYWWLNDDVTLDQGAMRLLITTADLLHERGEWPTIVVGSTRDPDTGEVTYGGRERTEPTRPFRFSLVQPGSQPVKTTTMNGNCVLVPREIVGELGNLSPEYRQQMGDHDYGLRAGKAGFGVWLAPGTVGTCRAKAPRNTASGSLLAELGNIFSAKELPINAWGTFTRRWGGPLWPLYFLSPYLRRSIGLIGERVLGRRG